MCVVHMRYIIIMICKMVIGFEGDDNEVFHPFHILAATIIMVINILHLLFKILTVQQID